MSVVASSFNIFERMTLQFWAFDKSSKQPLAESTYATDKFANTGAAKICREIFGAFNVISLICKLGNGDVIVRDFG